jgi:hypothetical protein
MVVMLPMDEPGYLASPLGSRSPRIEISRAGIGRTEDLDSAGRLGQKITIGGVAERSIDKEAQ